jgi:Zn ribbon nucleic-acid-binding protein
MGSIVRGMDCPNCKSRLFRDEYWYKTGEEEKLCFECGYQKSIRYKERDNGEYELLHPSKGFSLDNVIVDEFICDKPYGIAYIDYLFKNDEIIALSTEEQFIRKVLEPLNTPDKANITKVILSRFLNGQITKTIIYEHIKDNGADSTDESAPYLSNGDY